MTNQELQSLKNKFDIIGNDPALNRALEVAVKVAPVDMTVLVTGESGAGKENIPKIIHQFSSRKRGRYFAVNCGAIPEGTVDSELFGHEKGAFTGANEMRKGYFEEADGGTLFLDEIAELPLTTQAKLLRVLQSGEFIRVGSSKVLKTDVRVIAATNVDLRHAVSKGKFRMDLYYRLETITINVPALRERPGDINLLFRKFASDFSVLNRRNRISLTEDAAIMLRKYRWPGNVRQLKNVAEKISVMETGNAIDISEKCIIDADVLAKYIPKEEFGMTLASTPSSSQEKLDAGEREAIIRSLLQLKQEVDYIKEVLAKAGVSLTSVPVLPDPVKQEVIREDVYDEDPEDQELETKEEGNLSLKSANQELIEKVLLKHGGNRKAAAAELGISERTLYRKIKVKNDDEK